LKGPLKGPWRSPAAGRDDDSASDSDSGGELRTDDDGGFVYRRGRDLGDIEQFVP
jgi:hypothetical protein